MPGIFGDLDDPKKDVAALEPLLNSLLTRIFNKLSAAIIAFGTALAEK